MSRLHAPICVRGLPCSNLQAVVQRGSSRAHAKSHKYSGRQHTRHTSSFRQTRQKLFAFFSVSRRSGNAARSGSATEDHSRSWTSYLHALCSLLAATMASKCSSKNRGAYGAASGAANAAKPNLFRGNSTGDSMKGSRASHSAVSRSPPQVSLLHHCSCSSYFACTNGSQSREMHHSIHNAQSSCKCYTCSVCFATTLSV